MTSAERDFVRQRGGERCEYCLVAQRLMVMASLHIEHVLPRQHGGGDQLENLALACNQCNLHKGPNFAGLDPEDGKMVRLFNPRRDSWEEHFVIVGAEIIGRSPIGRATVRVFAMNDDNRLKLRGELLENGEWP